MKAVHAVAVADRNDAGAHAGLYPEGCLVQKSGS